MAAITPHDPAYGGVPGACRNQFAVQHGSTLFICCSSFHGGLITIMRKRSCHGDRCLAVPPVQFADFANAGRFQVVDHALNLLAQPTGYHSA